MTQQKLADELGLQRSTIAQYEAGRITPPGNILKKMASLFSVSIDMLLEDVAAIEDNDFSVFKRLSTGNSYADSIIRLSAKSFAKELGDGTFEQFTNNNEANYGIIESLLFFNYFAVKNKQGVLLLTDSENSNKFKKINENIHNFIKQILQTEKIYNLIVK
jgi:transcriptional regulator with XRE-family HTH domain